MKPIFAVTMGDPCGIGPEIVLKALSEYPDLHNNCQLIVCGSADIMKKTAGLISLNIDIHTISEDNISDNYSKGIICLDINPVSFDHSFGNISSAGGIHSFAYIAIELSQKKKINGVITAPINKKSLKAGKVPYLDHTEIFTKLTSSQRTMTLFVTGDLRVFFYSRHIPFKDISAALNIRDLVESLSDCRRYLTQIGIKEPTLALAALNPHGGEKGLFGTEEMDILEPAVDQAVNLGMAVVGPVPADSVFHLAKEGHYDAVLSLYHDQGHIAAKTSDFHRTVSLTMGLPFLRTSVDHGTAFDIAGKNVASEISLFEAIRAAIRYYW
jgi:4-hydroxythreonine-4-phosphate dehydrogenase